MFNSGGFPSSSASSPFGAQSAFKPNTGAFSSSVFGSGAGSSLFSGSTTQQSGLFGSTPSTQPFGQAQANQPAFGTSGSLFGTQQNVTPSTGIFGSTTNSAFGQSKPFGFGAQQPQSSGLFGQQAQPAPTQQMSLFGQPAAQASPGLFNTSSGFGGTSTGGTTIKFTPVTGTDTMVKNGASTNINTRHHCITCMKEYENKSLEELRLEDYSANRKGVQQGAQGSLGLFGSSGQSASLFGATSTSAFGGGTTSGVFGTGGTSNSLFGKPAGTVTAFGTPTSTTANTFGFNTPTPSNPFGTSTTQKPFGVANPQTGLFGQTTQASTIFGTQQTSGFGAFGTQQNTGGLFGAAKPAFNLGGTNTTSAFSFNQPSTTSTGSNLFGAKPATSTFGGFGTPATTSGFGTSSFGTTNQNTSIFGSSFGKPSTGFNFGTTTSTTAGSGGLNLGGGSLFGNTGNKPGIFGQTNLFGTNTFGNTGTTFNSGSGSLGTLGGNNQFGTSGFSNQQSLGYQYNNPMNQRMLAYASMPFGDSPLFKNLLPQTGKTDELLKPTSPASQRALITGQNFKASPKSNSKVKFIPVEASTKAFSDKTDNSPDQSDVNSRGSDQKQKSLFDGLDEEEDLGNDSFNQSIRQSPKRLVLRAKPINELMTNQKNVQFSSYAISEMSSVLKTSPRFSLQISQPTSVSDAVENRNANGIKKISHHIVKSLDPGPLENTMVEMNPNKDISKSPLLTEERRSKNDTTHDHPSLSSSSGDSDSEDPAVGGVAEDLPAGITLRRIGYYTIPKLDDLAHLVDSQGRCLVENFTIGRLNYGNIFFPDSMDVAGLNLDEIVHFRHKEVTLYPDDSKKPSVGEGLNRKAQVTLDRVWPIDKTTRLPITDLSRIDAMDYEGLLRRVSAKNNTKFVEYRPQTGSWVFKVDHFSKYGLTDSDEEEAVRKEAKKQKFSQPTLQAAAAPPFPMKQAPIIDPAPMQITDEDEDMDDEIRSPFDLDEKFERSVLSPTARLGRSIGASPHKIQVMKASFFNHPSFNIDGQYLDYEYILEQPSQKIDGFNFDSNKLTEALAWCKSSDYDLFTNSEPRSKMDPGPEEIPIHGASHLEMDESLREEIMEIATDQPKVYALQHWRKTLPYPKTTGGRLEGKCLLDVGLMKGRGFTLKWGPCSQLLCLAPSLDVSPDQIFGRILNDVSNNSIQRLAVTSHQHETSFLDLTEEHLMCALKHSVLEVQAAEVGPYFTCNPGVSSLEGHYSVAEQLKKTVNDKFVNFCANVWGLCQALWGPLSIEDVSDSHLTLQQRKLAVSEWVKSVVHEIILEELDEEKTHEELKENPRNILSYLSGFQISQACETAQKIGDHHLSSILSQFGSGPAVRTLAQRQLTQWRETQCDQYISTTRLKLFMLVAGLPTHQASDRLINACSELDWLRTFAFHLWYMTPLTGSLTDAFLLYEKAFLASGDSRYATPPLPMHASNSSQSSDEIIYDIHYHLLRLFSTKSHPLEKLLNPATYSSDHLDYSLSWFLMRVLKSLGYSHTSELTESIIHSSFASQLEANGLWHWAVFVLLHIPDSYRRKIVTLELINRHASEESLTEQEDFLLSKLKVPPMWVFEAKARKALFLQRYDDAAKFMIKAERWNDAHSIIINHICSRAIVNEEYAHLERLLEDLSLEKRQQEICEWQTQGRVILEYLAVVKEVERMILELDLEIERCLSTLQPQLTRLCRSIKLLPSNKSIDRLRQDEMTKRISGLVQNLMVATAKNDSPEGVSLLAQLVSELPLSGDHSQWEWLRLLASWCTSATH